VEHAAALLECACRVVLTDVSADALLLAETQLKSEFPTGEIYFRLMDVSELSSIQSVSESLSAEEIGIDILINNAAIDPKVVAGQSIVESSRLEFFPRAQWDMQIAVGLTGAFLCSQVFGRAMAESDGDGVILNISSDLSIFGPDQRLYHRAGLSIDQQPVKPVTYSVIKAGLIGLTRYLATYWADRGVRCNALSPGGVFTDQDDLFVRRVSSLIPMGRMATKGEYRAAIQFLCSSASSYMNGQNVVIDGGRSAW
jgi:NAD(P)-dependent dehydrogenase (short-subunit alcohol dehydrogenase family)